MPKFYVSTLISQPNDIVYKAYINPENMLKWSTDLESFEQIKGEFGEIGSYAHLHYNQKGRSYTLKDELKYLDPEKKIVSQVSGEGLKIIVTTLFEEMDSKTKITLIWDGGGTKFIFKLLLPVLKRKIKRQAQTELNTFKRMVEQYGVKFNYM